MIDTDKEQRLARGWRDPQASEAAPQLLAPQLCLVVKIARGFGGYGMGRWPTWWPRATSF